MCQWNGGGSVNYMSVTLCLYHGSVSYILCVYCGSVRRAVTHGQWCDGKFVTVMLV
jgi:hypothetical protein